MTKQTLTPEQWTKYYCDNPDQLTAYIKTVNEYVDRSQAKLDAYAAYVAGKISLAELEAQLGNGDGRTS